MKKFAFRVLLVLLLLSMLAQPFSAGELQTGSISLEYSHSGAAYAGLEISIRRVADIAPNGDHKLSEPYDGFPVNIGGITSQNEWKNAAGTLATYIAAYQMAADHTAKTDENGLVVFDGLQEGIYLISGATAEDDRGVCRFEDFFIFLPTPGDDGKPNYDMTALPKGDFTPAEDDGEDEPEFVPYQVVKVWKDTGNRNRRPSQITVDLLKDNVVQQTVILNASNNWNYRWQAEAGEKWSVVERDVPDDYRVVITENNTVFQITNTHVGHLEVPKTGDTAALWLYVLAMCLSGIGLLIIAIAAKRRTSREKNQ